ncbi:hypothetical protein EVAR_64365_1 [Eumeta japonica]|uniref:Uncharacterized protein n=1 Tax=Eumeta variegata TaxID=151549 RepID=A0A4C2A1A6_EUMVA|nr:hypothetical protein EVAR_64365_1 [Eumeta japonica]
MTVVVFALRVTSSDSRDRLVVRTPRCGRGNPGSNPGHGSARRTAPHQGNNGVMAAPTRSLKHSIHNYCANPRDRRDFGRQLDQKSPVLAQFGSGAANNHSHHCDGKVRNDDLMCSLRHRACCMI